jgi:hypothetical protein
MELNFEAASRAAMLLTTVLDQEISPSQVPLIIDAVNLAMDTAKVASTRVTIEDGPTLTVIDGGQA